MRAFILVVTVAWLAAVGVSGCGQSGGGGTSEASCTGPVLTGTANHSEPAPRITVSPGQMLRVNGYGYATCHDTNQQPPASPFSHLEVLVVQGHRRFPVATLSPRQDGSFQVAIRMPAGLRPGTATVSTSQAGERPLTVHIAG